MFRRLTVTLFGGLVPAVLMGSIGCNSDGAPGEQDDLQALLRDRELTLETRSALTQPTPDAGMTSTGAAGAVGGLGGGVATDGGFAGSIGSFDGGATGVAGAPGDGGVTKTGMAGATGTTGAAGGPFSDGGFGGMSGAPSPLGNWTFDDCSASRTDLFDSGPNGNTAFRAVSAQCAPGISGQAVSIQKTGDIVYVPDQPSFTFVNGITVAGWFNPSSTRQVRTLMRKRDQGTSDFALLLNDGTWQFVINLGGGRAASVSAPKAKPNTWTHVAGTYDGTWLRIYIAGLEAAKLKVRGTISPGPGPLLMGNDGSERRLDGLMDNLFFDGTAATADQVLALTCIPHDPTIAATPATSAPTLPGTPASFDIAITNNSTPSCAPSQFLFETEAFIPGITIDPQFTFAPPVNGGATTHITMTVTATDDPDPGTYTIPFITFDETKASIPAQGSVDFVLAADGCRVSRAKELMITSPTVVDDPVRTTGSGVWTFKHLMEAMAPTPDAAPAMVEAMMKTFTTDQTVNSFTIEARPEFQSQILDTWPRTADGGLDLSQAPFMLQAIVDRFDLRNLSNGDAGEGRFVFGFFPPGSFFPPQATLIMEYKLPAATDADVQGWADAWHGLGALTQGTPEYNAALEAITERFASRGQRPGHPNDSAINAVRTNEIAFGDNGRWQMREFGLSADTGTLVPATIKLTPDLTFNGTDTVAAFINANEASIIAETHTVPLEFQGAPFATGSVFNDLEAWIAPGINNNEARFHFSLNTCNGCHSAQETGTFFLQISPRTPGGEAQLSGFLTGITVSDPVSGETRTFNDLQRRATDLKSIECPGSVTPPPAPTPPPGADGGVAPPPIPVPPDTKPPIPLARPTSLRMGISRVH